MDAQVVAQRDFSAGQLDLTAIRADDTEIMRAGLRTARNVRILATRGLTRRPGRRLLFSTTGITEIVNPVSGVEWYMTFEANSVIFRRSDLGATVTFAGMPWSGAILGELRWVESGGSVVVSHQSFRPQIFTYSVLTGSWTTSAFAFALDPSGSVRQPYHNFYPGAGIVMTPSARTGSIVVLFNANILNAAHVGVVFRYAGRQFLINSLNSANSANCTVIEELPPTYNVVVDNVAGLQVGDLVEGVTSGARGQVTAIGGTTLTVLVGKNWAGFEATEILVGPRSKMKVTSQAAASSAGTEQWDEALISPARGWPGCVSKDSRRIIFTKFAQAGSAIVWSAIGTLNDFLVGAEKEDSIFEFVPENCTVLDVLGGADEFIFTDKGTYYVPISASSPLIPGSIDFRLISDDPSSTIRPRQTTEGIVFLNRGLTRVFAIVGTGQTTRPYIVDDLSEYHSSLIRSPVCLAASSSDASVPERYLYGCNSDGSIAVARYQRAPTARGWVGWVPWDGLGLIRWIAAGTSSVVVTVEYAGARYVEVFADDEILDASRPVSEWPVGSQISVEKDGRYLGEYRVEADGSLSNDIPASRTTGMRGGYRFGLQVEPFVPHVDGGLSRKQRMRPRRIKQVGVTVQRTQAIKIGGHLIPFYRVGENQEVAGPLRDETYRTRLTGRSFDPRWSLEQDLPGALTLVEMTTEVTL